MSFGRLTARKIAAARQMQRYGFEYPKEWETDYLERSQLLRMTVPVFPAVIFEMCLTL